jgi:transcriptional regulator with XRE-family HTH domain
MEETMIQLAPTYLETGDMVKTGSGEKTTPLARWLYGRRTARGLTMKALAEMAGVSHPRIVQIEKGGSATRDMIERLAGAMVHGAADAEERERLTNEGLAAGGFTPYRDPEPEIPGVELLREAGWSELDDEQREILGSLIRQFKRDHTDR